MTASPLGWQLPPNSDHPLTTAEYERLPEDTEHRWELQEGWLVMSLSPKSRHMVTTSQLIIQLAPQLPTGLGAIPDIDINLELAAPDEPGNVRRPDLIIVDSAAYERSDAEGTLLRASEVLVIVEIVSRGSVRMDNVIKRGEYADAGIPHYWIIDVDEPVSLVDCHLAGEFGYQDNGGVAGVFTASVPFPVRLDLDALVRLTP
ncbi:Uma2 family endonuclease [Kutzneria buriramensis]|uniref:Uma2 family endonuclease n=1 Tax=Kutzneria buriramensis TaxID=1045776 RepID=A0A3E0HZZ3_9PSEU|nr:Uma2 family endonuclease [Kutzneria buriramensis]REH52044.1 Uma2 family endonuclease [Kutzneria buriramensis]